MFVGRSFESIVFHKISRTRQIINRVVCARCQPAALAMIGLLSVFFMFSPVFSKQARADESNLNTALLLADVLRAARREIASLQPTINDELIGDKGLSGEVVQKVSSPVLKTCENPVFLVSPPMKERQS